MYGLKPIYSRYWDAYGGFKALFRSFYLHAAIVITAIASNFWLTEKWWEQSNLLGFSLGGFAMFLGFGDEKFRALLAESDESDADGDEIKPSVYLLLCSSFVHFILLQVIALFFAIIAKSLDFYYPWPILWQGLISNLTLAFGCLGYLLFIYSMTSVLAATMAVFRTCSWYEKHQQALNKKQREQPR